MRICASKIPLSTKFGPPATRIAKEFDYDIERLAQALNQMHPPRILQLRS